MKLPSLLLIRFVALAVIANAVTPAVTEFAKGEKTKFSTQNHAKAKGLNMTISYPNSWAAKEEDTPNVLQKFVSDGGKGTEMVMIITKSLPAGTTLRPEEAKDLYTEESLKEFLPDGATFLSGRATKIEGLAAGILEYSQRAERAGMVIDTQVITYIFFSGSTMVLIQCQVGGLPGSKVAVADHMAEFKPLSTLIASSIILPDKWK